MLRKVKILAPILTFLVLTPIVSFPIQNETNSISIYFIKGEKGKEILCPASRLIKGTREIEIIKEVFTELRNGPSKAEKQDDLKSFLPHNIEFKEVELIEKIAIIGLDCSAWEVITLSNEEIVKTVAQLIYTLTELPFVKRVVFIARGRLIFVKQDDRYIYELDRNLEFLARFLK